MLKSQRARAVVAALSAYLFLFVVFTALGFFNGYEHNDIRNYGFRGAAMWLIMYHVALVLVALINVVVYFVMNWITNGVPSRGTPARSESDTRRGQSERRSDSRS